MLFFFAWGGLVPLAGTFAPHRTTRTSLRPGLLRGAVMMAAAPAPPAVVCEEKVVLSSNKIKKEKTKLPLLTVPELLEKGRRPRLRRLEDVRPREDLCLLFEAEGNSTKTKRRVAQSLTRRALALERRGRRREAALMLERALQVRSEPKMWSLLVKWQTPLHARETVREAVRRYPRNGELWRKSAEFARKACEWPLAREHYKRSVTCDSQLFAAWDGWARMELKLRRPSFAVLVARKGLEATGAFARDVPKAARLWQCFALCLNGARGVPPEIAMRQAEKAFLRGLGASPRDPYLLHGYGLQLVKLKERPLEARASLEAAERGGHPEAALSLARLAETEGRLDDARRAYERATRSSSIAAWRARARFEAYHGTDALEIYAEASSKFPLDVELRVQRSKHLSFKDDLKTARHVLVEGILLFPTATRLYQALGELEATKARTTVLAEKVDADERERRRLELECLLCARAAFTKGARAVVDVPEERDHLCVLLFSWAHAEWAIGTRGENAAATTLRRKRTLSESSLRTPRRLFESATTMALKGRDLRTLAFIMRSRAVFERWAAEDKTTATKLANLALKLDEKRGGAGGSKRKDPYFDAIFLPGGAGNDVGTIKHQGRRRRRQKEQQGEDYLGDGGGGHPLRRALDGGLAPPIYERYGCL